MLYLIAFFLYRAHATCDYDYKLLTNQSATVEHFLVPPFSGSQLGDPASPFTNTNGDVEIYGTGNTYLSYANTAESTGLKSLLNAKPPRMLKLRLAHPDGTPINEGNEDEAPWDIAIQTWPEGQVLYAGVMTPAPGHTHADFYQDNWNRRVFAFRLNHGVWIREKNPLSYPASKSWVGHSYGHHFITDELGQTWMFYERVFEERNGIPWTTGLYARKMLTPFRASLTEQVILDPSEMPYPALNRGSGGKLVEGARPFKVWINGKSKYVVLFSSGDFPTNHYGINIASSDHILGPYQPELTHDGTDLKDFGQPLRASGRFGWGPSRGSLFQNLDGKWFLLFHAVRAHLWPNFDFEHWPDFSTMPVYRDFFVAPVEFGFLGGNSSHIDMAFKCPKNGPEL